MSCKCNLWSTSIELFILSKHWCILELVNLPPQSLFSSFAGGEAVDWNCFESNWISQILILHIPACLCWLPTSSVVQMHTGIRRLPVCQMLLESLNWSKFGMQSDSCLPASWLREIWESTPTHPKIKMLLFTSKILYCCYRAHESERAQAPLW